jgi:phage FluMu protein Com
MRPRWEVADVITSHGKSFLKSYPQCLQVVKTLMAIRDCRTAVLGGHKQQCSCCGYESYQHNSCRNRHCPKCQTVNREKWIWNREQELLPVPYFHIVFTLPDALNAIALNNPKEVYNALFRAAWQTINQFGKDPKHIGADTGMTAVLHTWGQNLSLHPHLHCIVPGGGITKTGQWKQARNNGKYLFPTYGLARVYRAKFMSLLRGSSVKIKQSVAKKLFGKQWVVYTKRPFLGPKQVIEYLGRYTHKIAISNHRIKQIDKDGTVHFFWKNYRKSGTKAVMQLTAHEFLRRFSQHILPPRFVRIRHYGMLSSRNKSKKLNQARDYFSMEQWEKPEAINWKLVAEQRMNFIPDQCPKCKEGIMEIIEVINPARGPPLNQFIKHNTSLDVA